MASFLPPFFVLEVLPPRVPISESPQIIQPIKYDPLMCSARYYKGSAKDTPRVPGYII